MKELSPGEIYNKSYVAIPITESPLFRWVQSINGNKNFYHITICFLGNIDYSGFEAAKSAISEIPTKLSGVSIIPEGLNFLGKNGDVFVLKVKETDELLKIRKIMEDKCHIVKLSSEEFVPHITIRKSTRGVFNNKERTNLTNIPDISDKLDPYNATRIGLYYRTEEGATAILYTRKI